MPRLIDRLRRAVPGKWEFCRGCKESKPHYLHESRRFVFLTLNNIPVWSDTGKPVDLTPQPRRLPTSRRKAATLSDRLDALLSRFGSQPLLSIPQLHRILCSPLYEDEIHHTTRKRVPFEQQSAVILCEKLIQELEKANS